jgi:hypothetical protein
MDQDDFFRRLHRSPRGEVIAAQLPATLPGRTAWLGIYPLNLASDDTAAFVRRAGVDIAPGEERRGFHIRTFELADSLRDEWFCEAHMENKRSYVIVGDDALLAKLAELGVSLDSLDVAWRTNYPL